LRRISSVLLGAALLLSAAGDPGATELSARLPELTLENLEGGAVDIATLAADGPVLLDFWATWCSPCRRSLPHYQRLAEAYAEAGLRVITVSQDTPRLRRRIAPTLESIGVSLPVLLDPQEELGRELGVLSLPTTFLVAKGGEISMGHLGFVDGDEVELERQIRELLGLDPED